MGSASHLIQHVKLRQKTDFSVYDMNSLKDMGENRKGDWEQIPQSIIALGAFLKWGLYLILFSMSSYARKQSFGFITCIV